MRSTINPRNNDLIPPDISPKSVILLSTSSQIVNTTEKSINLFQKYGLQVIVAGVDTVVGEKNGLSELWLDEYVTIENSVLLEEKDAKKKELRRSDGIHIVTARENWRKIESSFNISLNQTNKLKLALANTIFQTTNLVTLFYFQPSSIKQGQNHSGQTLCDLSVALPEISLTRVESFDKWTPLYDESDGEFLVSNCTGNLIKGINKKPAAKFLETNERLMSIASKETKVYVKIYKPGSSSPQKFEVIAGGGGWGAKADMIALSPDAKPTVGDRIEFFMLTPRDRYNREKAIEEKGLISCLNFECNHEDVNYEEEEESVERIVLEGTFGGGAEEGFEYNEVNFKSPGERVKIGV